MNQGKEETVLEWSPTKPGSNITMQYSLNTD